MIRHDDASLLKALIAPESVALVGVSGSSGKLTARPLELLQANGWQGRIYPVNPTRDEIGGLKAYKSVRELPEGVDHAYILLNADPALEALEDCARTGVKVVSILADGFAEAGEEGRLRQERLVRIAEEAGILLIGPNSTGVVATTPGFVCTTNAAFRAGGITKGRLAVLSQSGSVIGTMLSRGKAQDTGFSVLVSTGNEATAGVGRLGQLLLDDSGTDGFILFLETIRDRDAVAAFARGARARGKPVVAYMIGRSEEGQALSVSHTGALTGSARSVSAFLASVGVREVEAFESLIPVARTLSQLAPVPSRPRSVTVVSTTGGGGAMVIDQLALRGVPIAGLSDASRAKLAAQGIPLGHGKLVDVTLAGTRYDRMKEVVSTLMADPETGMLLVVIGSSAQFNPELAVAPIVDARADAPAGAAPVLAFPLPHAPESLTMLEAGGVPAFRTVETCAEAIAALFAPVPDVEPVAAALPAEAEALIAVLVPGTQGETTSARVMRALGVPGPLSVVLAPHAELPADLGIPYPVVAKLVSADLPHKTEAGAIRVGVTDRAALMRAIADMKASAEAHRPGFRLEGILIQEMCQGLGEALIGLTRDPVAGPMVTVAMGGVMTEIYRDSAVHPAPVDIDAARAMIAQVKGFALLSGYRNRPKGDLEALAHAVAAVSALAGAARIQEAEINPILVRPEGEGVVMLDALLSVVTDGL
ncbi:acyl-CoA synthetase (NDP forming) [Pseudochelatococcus lubricantis]|uniref:Acyl-CoA synthetase (NDP forming) n=1 Tax=Pseudochelatococcus lubricantis TaxID=1538102 RepID=A0ABX0V186_9HYPH|nr:acyl-CoA synthetase (NDP forming) [Pseudochelatococcus lubricantis]